MTDKTKEKYTIEEWFDNSKRNKDKPHRNCGMCRYADSWGIPLGPVCTINCKPTVDGGSVFVHINS